MATHAPESGPKRTCPRCGAELPAGVPPELCPKCLLKAGLGGGQPQQPSGETLHVAPAPRVAQMLDAGQTFGHYRIIRNIGGGGMGSVFEAEDLESGRRVALKVLSHALDSPEARERFFREGRLAASINHPNSVYVFGTEEVAGTPVISMELVSGGTLQDWVRTLGPMPWAEAVDAALQIISGLEAAQRIGILHRDVKPSNCFLDAEGATKIGDFGLSISTALRTEPSLTATGAFLGTPAFCSPEQLRGEELSARADIYSLGATLFYLLTGRTPFEAQNVVALLATVLERQAPSPRQFAPQVPHGLAKVVRRCLEKQPGERFRNYEELRQALAPYSSTAPVPAPLGYRFLAGAIDMAILNLSFGAVTLLVLGDPTQILEHLDREAGTPALMIIGSFVLALAYYTVCEGIWGATPGKAICRVRVVGPSRSAPGLGRAMGRALFYIVLPMVPFWLSYGYNFREYISGTGPIHYLRSFSYYILLALLFCTARRKNGFAAIHDLVTRTRVIIRSRLAQRATMVPEQSSSPSAEQVQARQMVGPYHILETMSHGEWLLGYDLRLLRKVWIRLVPPGTPPVTQELRNVGRPGRLRWLTGRRAEGRDRSPSGPPQQVGTTSTSSLIPPTGADASAMGRSPENWDAYEAPAGQPLLTLCAQPQPWSAVRYWLHDLSRELSAAAKDNTVPELALDRVWITGESRAKLLDFPFPGSSAHYGKEVFAEQGRFLDGVAAVALSGRAEARPVPAAEVRLPLPLHARECLRALTTMTDSAAAATRIEPLLHRSTEVSRLRRAAVLGGCLVIVIPVIVGVVFGTKVMEHLRQRNPGLIELNTLLHARWAARTFPEGRPTPADEAFATYTAGHYRAVVTNQAIWNSAMGLALIKGDSRKFAEESIAQHASVSPEELAKAEESLKAYLPPPDVFSAQRLPGVPLMAVNASLILYVGLPALIAALLFRGGLVLRIAGIRFARRDGLPASRLRVFWRALVCWIPVFFALILTLHPSAMKMPVRQALVLLGLASLVGLSLALRRSIPDRLAGTWPVLK